MLAQRYEFYVLVARTISHSFTALTPEILFLPLERKIHIFSPLCNILYIFVMNFAKFVLYFCCYFWISYSSLTGEFDVFSYGDFSSYKKWVSAFRFRFLGNGETSGFDICCCKLRTKQALLLTTKLKRKRQKRIIASI